MASTVRIGLRVASIALSRATAPVEVRERLACQQDWASLFSAWVQPAREWAILSTCHRFELYIVAEGDELEVACAQLCNLLSAIADYDPSDGTGIENTESTPWVVRTDDDAANHLCRVAAGLDSLVLGEAQIQGQVISAYTTGLEEGSIGPLLSVLFRTAIRVGKRSRTETQISTRAVSMSSVALSMAAHHFTDFAQARVVVVGAGEMSRLALKALRLRQVINVIVANRTLAHAHSALLHPAWQAISLDELPQALQKADVVFSATSSPDLIITRTQVIEACVKRKLVLIDLALPRDVDPAVRDLPNVVLVDVDDLRHGLDQSLTNREHSVPAVNAIIDDEIARWRAQQRELSMRPLVVELRQRAERIRQQEVERTIRFLGPVDSDTLAHIQHLSRALVNKLLHKPTVRIKELAHNDEADVYASALCDIFGLEFGLESTLPIPPQLENAELRGDTSRI
jgi:glutamyl-tRNA reductase